MTKGAYDLEANLALLRFYQYAPATAKIPVVCKVSFLQLAAACCRFAHSLPFPPSLTISSTPPSLSLTPLPLSLPYLCPCRRLPSLARASAVGRRWDAGDAALQETPAVPSPSPKLKPNLE